MSSLIRTMAQHEQLNFLLTNRIPRRLANQFVGWLSAIESPWLTRQLIRVWKVFADDLYLEEAQQREFSSLHACFTRELQAGRRPIDNRANILVSPCDAIVGAHGDIAGMSVFQAKGFPYELDDLIPDSTVRNTYRNGKFITLRLTSSMYHRFHAPLDCRIREVTYISGDTWNVNPIALKRIEKLYCKNERAVIELQTSRDDCRVCLVAVAAILVASIRLNWLDTVLRHGHQGPARIGCDATFAKGDELGYFQHGSTIILLATAGYSFCKGIQVGERIRMGEPLLSLPESASVRNATTPNINQVNEEIT